MINQPITVINKLGLHTRAAAKLVATAARFESKIELQRDKHVINCKSIMGVITLGATKGTTLDLKIEGGDELEARDAILHLFHEKFGESE